MIVPKEERGAYRWAGHCPDCNGCINDRCPGCDRRFCTGTYSWMQWDAPGPEHKACNRCPNKVDKRITDPTGHPRTIRVRCNADTGHGGICHWNPWHAGRNNKP